MFDTNEILARLQNGEDIQKIADEMTATLNYANKAYTDQKAKEEAERKAAEAKKAADSQKRDELQGILDEFVIWFSVHYGDGNKIELDIDADDVIELIDSLNELTVAFKGLEKHLDLNRSYKPVKKIVKSDRNADETINNFLKQMGW